MGKKKKQKITLDALVDELLFELKDSFDDMRFEIQDKSTRNISNLSIKGKFKLKANKFSIQLKGVVPLFKWVIPLLIVLCAFLYFATDIELFKLLANTFASGSLF